MEQAAKLARLGDRLVSLLAGGLILLMLLYGGYSLWDTAMVYSGAFLSEELLAFKPASDDPNSNPTLTELQEINPDVRAWLTVYETNIDYPVVQGETDWDYINTDIYGEFALSGSIFLDSRNSPGFSDAYNIVYGHHMDNGGMFGDVVEFVNTSYFQAHPTGRLYLPQATYDITFFACAQVDAYDHTVYNPIPSSQGGVGELVKYAEDMAVQYRDIGVRDSDQIIALSTCAEAQTNGRVVIFGRLDRVSEAAKE